MNVTSYEVEDIEPQEDGKPLCVIMMMRESLSLILSHRRYSASLRSSLISIIPLPDKDAAHGTPAHISSYQEFPTGATVMALYPDTSCFYRAEVVASPKDIPTQGRVSCRSNRAKKTASEPGIVLTFGSFVQNSALGAYYKLKFEDDDDQEHLVSAAEVVEWPGQ